LKILKLTKHALFYLFIGENPKDEIKPRREVDEEDVSGS
jgi:hypothetical protein